MNLHGRAVLEATAKGLPITHAETHEVQSIATVRVLLPSVQIDNAANQKKVPVFAKKSIAIGARAKNPPDPPMFNVGRTTRDYMRRDCAGNTFFRSPSCTQQSLGSNIEIGGERGDW